MKYVERLLGSRLFKLNAGFFIGTGFSAAINYLFYPILGRIMSLESFGEVQVLFSIFLQLGIVLSVFGMVTVNLVTNDSDTKHRNAALAELERFALVLMAIFAIGVIVLSPLLGRQLQFQSSGSFIVLMFAALASVPAGLRGSYLQGIQDFWGYSIAQNIAAFSKLIFSIALVKIGFDTVGPIIALVLAQLAMVIYLNHRARSLGYRWLGSKFHFPDLLVVKKQLPYIFMVTGVTLVTTVLFSSDIIYAKRYFSPQEAGLYAGIATLARIIIFASGSVAGVLLTAIKLTNPTKQNRQVLMFSLALVASIGGALLAIFSFAPEFIVSTMLGSRYIPAAYLLPHLSLAIFLITIINVISIYFVALRRKTALYILLFGLFFTLNQLWVYHSSLLQIVQGLTYGSILVILCYVGWAVYRQTQISLTRNE